MSIRRHSIFNQEKAVSLSIGVSTRHITNVSQFNPIHDFSARKGIPQATDMKQFRAMVVNPGPLRILYSPDYIDWYYKAYNNRARFEKEKTEKAQRFNGATIAGCQSHVPGLSNKSIRPASSLRRLAGESIKKKAQSIITECSIQHGIFDVFERQAQFPNIHIDKCSDDHILEIFNEMILPSSMSIDDIWEKALLYRALLTVRKQNYPDSFDYMKKVAQDVALRSTDNEASKGLLPDESAAKYFEYIVKKYHVENANEASVILQCHRLPDAEKLLFSNPPPLAEADEIKCSIPPEYPSLSSLKNILNRDLLRCLIFGEFNFIVSADPFFKYPEAIATVQRPKSETTLSVRANPNTAIAVAVGIQRGSLLAPLTPNIGTNIDGRGRDVLRSQQSNAQGDNFFNKELSRRLEAEPGLYAADRTQYNPRAIRAEERDFTTRQLLKALRVFDSAESNLVHRTSHDQHRIGRNSDRVPGLLGNISVLPTVAHFTNLLLSDRHIGFAVAALETEKANLIRNYVVDSAEILYEIAREYTVEHQRLLLGEKLRVVASLLDFEISEAFNSFINDPICGTAARQLGTYNPLASRKLDQMGQTTTARADDYNRWMRPLDKNSL